MREAARSGSFSQGARAPVVETRRLGGGVAGARRCGPFEIGGGPPGVRREDLALVEERAVEVAEGRQRGGIPPVGNGLDPRQGGEIPGRRLGEAAELLRRQAGAGLGAALRGGLRQERAQARLPFQRRDRLGVDEPVHRTGVAADGPRRHRLLQRADQRGLCRPRPRT